jgi:hypothetical protein
VNFKLVDFESEVFKGDLERRARLVQAKRAADGDVEKPRRVEESVHRTQKKREGKIILMHVKILIGLKKLQLLDIFSGCWRKT